MTSPTRPPRRRILFFIFHFSFSILILVSCGRHSHRRQGRLARPVQPAPAGAANASASRLPARRGPARHADRVVVLHRAPARGGRSALRLRVGDLPVDPQRHPAQLRRPHRDHRPPARHLPLRPADERRRQPARRQGQQRLRLPRGRMGQARPRRARPRSRARLLASPRARPDRDQAAGACIRAATSTWPGGWHLLLLAHPHDRARHDRRTTACQRPSPAKPGSTTSGATSWRSARAAGTGSPPAGRRQRFHRSS